MGSVSLTLCQHLGLQALSRRKTSRSEGLLSATVLVCLLCCLLFHCAELSLEQEDCYI
jgi:hypothetical protein